MLKRSITLLPRGLRTIRYSSTEAYTSAILSLKKDLKKSMIAKNELQKNTIKGILSEIKNKEIDNKTGNNDEFMLFDTYSKLINQRFDSIKNYLENKREDMAEKEKNEIEIIKKYQLELPVASTEEIKIKVHEWLINEKEKEPKLQLKQIFGKIDWKTLPTEWKTTQAAIKSCIVKEFKSKFS